MGDLWSSETELEQLELPNHLIFIPTFTNQPKEKDIPTISAFREDILQAVLRQHLLESKNLSKFLQLLDLKTLEVEALEVLSEKAISEGHVDLMIKEANPVGMSKKIIVEVKLRNAKTQTLTNLKNI